MLWWVTSLHNAIAIPITTSCLEYGSAQLRSAPALIDHEVPSKVKPLYGSPDTLVKRVLYHV